MLGQNGAVSIRTFHPRRGRLSGRHHEALSGLADDFGFPWPDGPLSSDDLATIFGRRAPLVLEIGSGMGDAAAAMAAASPDRDFLAVDVHTPGVANLLALAADGDLTNVRVAQGDALELLPWLPVGGLAAIHAYFPDPWPKARHHKRRLIQPGHVRLMASRLVTGGALHCATDWGPYAESMLQVLRGEPLLCNEFEGFSPRPGHRPLTKFEQRGLVAGRVIHDLIFRRTENPPSTVDRGCMDDHAPIR